MMPRRFCNSGYQKATASRPERLTFRQHAAAIVQGYRPADAAFLIFQNEELERYTALFNLAARICLPGGQRLRLRNRPAQHDRRVRLFSTKSSAPARLGVIENGQPQFPARIPAIPAWPTPWPNVCRLERAQRPRWASTTRMATARPSPSARRTTGSPRPPTGDNNWQTCVATRDCMPDLLADSDVKQHCLQIDDGNGARRARHRTDLQHHYHRWPEPRLASRWPRAITISVPVPLPPRSSPWAWSRRLRGHGQSGGRRHFVRRSDAASKCPDCHTLCGGNPIAYRDPDGRMGKQALNYLQNSSTANYAGSLLQSAWDDTLIARDPAQVVANIGYQAGLDYEQGGALNAANRLDPLRSVGEAISGRDSMLLIFGNQLTWTRRCHRKQCRDGRRKAQAESSPALNEVQQFQPRIPHSRLAS